MRIANINSYPINIEIKLLQFLRRIADIQLVKCSYLPGDSNIPNSVQPILFTSLSDKISICIPQLCTGMYLVIVFIIYQKRNDGMIVINRIGIYLNRIYMEIISRLIVSDFSISYLTFG